MSDPWSRGWRWRTSRARDAQCGLEGELARLREEHRDLDGAIEALERSVAGDQLQIQRLKKRKLTLRDRIFHIEDAAHPRHHRLMPVDAARAPPCRAARAACKRASFCRDQRWRRLPVAIIMGSQSDWATMRHAAETLDALGVPYDARIVSAHRTPDRLVAFAKGAARPASRSSSRARAAPRTCPAWRPR